MYKIVRFYYGDRPGQSSRRTIKTGFTLAEARAHCHDPETSSRTAKGPNARRVTRQHGPWFDGYEECRR